MEIENLTRSRFPKQDVLQQALQNPVAVIRELNNRSLYHFLQYFWKVVSAQKFQPNWHIEYLCGELEKVAERVGKRQKKEYDLLINVPPGSTKPLWEEMDVLMGDGFYKKLKDIQKGDFVINRFGKVTEVTGVYVQGNLPCVKIHTFGGRDIFAAYDHPILTADGWRNAIDITEGQMLALMHTQEIQGTTERTLDEFRLAGYIIGDGSISQNNCMVCGTDMEYIEDLISCIDRLGFGYYRHIDKNGVTVVNLKQKEKQPKVKVGTYKGMGRGFRKYGGPRQWLRDIGIHNTNSRTKKVPDFVWKGTNEQIKIFLAAYFQCDGCVSYRHSNKRNVVVSTTTISKELAIGIQRLFLRIGVSMKIRNRIQKNGYAYNPNLKDYVYYTVDTTEQDSAVRFLEQVPLIGYKLEKLKTFAPRRRTFDQEYWPDEVVSIEKIGNLPCRCLSVSDGESFVVDGVVVHNTITCSIIFPVWCWTKWPFMRFITASYSGALSLESADYSRELIRSQEFQQIYPDLVIKDDKDVKSNFRIAKREWNYPGKPSRMVPGGNRYSTSVGGTLTGFHGDILIWDDALNPTQAASDIELANANHWIEQTLSTRKTDKDVSVTIGIMQRLHQCLLPNTRVFTKNGITEIKNIKQNEEVLTSKGWQDVLETGQKAYKGKVLGLCLSGHPEIPWITIDHKVYAEKGWVDGDKLTKQDILLFPILNEKELSNEEIRTFWPDIPFENEPPKIFKQSFVGNQKRVPYEELKTLVDRGYTSRQMSIYFGFKSRQMIDLYIAKYELIRKNVLLIKKDIINDFDFWRIVGYWVAEGSLSKGRRKISYSIRFSFGNNDIELVKDTYTVLKKYGFNPTIKDTGYNTTNVFCASYQLALFLEQFGIGAGNKHLPEWCNALPLCYFKQLLKGYWLGDGCCIRNSIRISSISLRLLSDIQRNLLSFGIVSAIFSGRKIFNPSIVKTGPGKDRVIQSKKQPYEIRIAKKDINKLFWVNKLQGKYTKETINKINGEWLHVKINDILEKEYDGLVYDITTPAHDFLVGLSMLHNSDPTGNILAKQKENIKHICIPGEARNYRKQINPPELYNYYIDDLMDPKRMSWTTLKDLEADLGQYGYAGQIGQDPTPPGGGMFKVDHLQIINALPKNSEVVRAVRAWDKAGTADAGAYTVGVKMIQLVGNRWVVEDVKRGRWGSAEREQIIKETANADGLNVEIWVEQEPGPIWEEELVQMANGLKKKLKDIKEGDLIINGNGEPTKVLKIYKQGELENLRITTNSGRVIHVSKEHSFLTPNDWVKAENLNIEDVLALKTDIKTTVNTQLSLEECRLAGYIIGDGCCTWTRDKKITCNANIVASDEIEGLDIVHCAEEMQFGVHIGGSKGWTYYLSGGARDWLKERGLAGKNTFTKEVPKWLQIASKECIANFLGAYFACDGSVGYSKDHPYIDYYSTNLELIKIVQSLLLRFGIYTMLRTRNYNPEFQKSRHLQYRLVMRRGDGSMGRFAKNIPVYGVKDFKLKKYQHTVFDQPYLPDPIINIEKAGKLLCRCLVVAKGDSFLVNDIVVHNSSGKESAEGTIRNLAGYVCRAQTATGDKTARADPFSVQVNNGGVMLLNGGWVHLFVEELRFFPYSTYKDQTDAASLAFSKLVAKKMARVIR